MSCSPELRLEESFPEPMETETADAALVRDTLAGERAAFEEIVALYHQRVFGFLHRMTKQREDAEDLTQQTFIKAFDNLSQFHCGRPLINWLLTIARNNALNHFRTLTPCDPVPEHFPDAGRSPATVAEEREESANLWDCARTILPRLQFEVLWLRFGEDLSVKATAEVAGLSQTHVKILVFRARRALLKSKLRP